MFKLYGISQNLVGAKLIFPKDSQPGGVPVSPGTPTPIPCIPPGLGEVTTMAIGEEGGPCEFDVDSLETTLSTDDPLI